MTQANDARPPESRPAKKRRWLRRLIVLAVVAALAVAAIHPRTLALAGRWLNVGDSPQQVDAVVLLNGGYNTRPFVAAALVHGGWSPRILLATVAPHASEAAGEVPSSTQIVLPLLKYGGVERDRVEILPAGPKATGATTTFDEAGAVARYCDVHAVRRLLIVTEGPHTRRAAWIFRRTLGDRPVEIAMISAPTDGFDTATWWRSRDGFLFVASEYFKLLYYQFRYGWLGYELLVFAAALVLWRQLRRRRAV